MLDFVQVLIRECPAAAWASSDLILPVFCKLTQVKPRPSEDSVEAITAKNVFYIQSSC